MTGQKSPYLETICHEAKVNKHSIEQLKQIVQRISQVPSLTNDARAGIERIARMSWIEELAALAKLWRFCPELVEQYLDAMVCELHEFPEPTSTNAQQHLPLTATDTEPPLLN